MSLNDKLIAAALMGAVLGAAGCASSPAAGEPTTPAAGDKASCKGAMACKNADGTDKASCKGAAAPAAPAAP